MWTTIDPENPGTLPENFTFCLAEVAMPGNLTRTNEIKKEEGSEETIIGSPDGHKTEVRTCIALHNLSGAWTDEVGMPVNVLRWHAFPGDELSLDDLQDQHLVWEEHNFPGQLSANPLLGLAEEVGELTLAHMRDKNLDGLTPRMLDTLAGSTLWGSICHGVLKSNQKIRGNENHEEEIYDASVNLMRAIRSILGPQYWDALEDAHKSDGIVTSNKNAQIGDSCGDILVYLANYANKSDVEIRLQAALDTTWGEVKKRDWKNDPHTGQSNP